MGEIFKGMARGFGGCFGCGGAILLVIVILMVMGGVLGGGH